MANDIPPRVTYSFYTPVDVDREKLIDVVYQAQVDLQLMADWLSRQPEPTMLFGAVECIRYYRRMLVEVMPSVARH